MKIIYHTGTGTWFDLDDGVVVIDTDYLPPTTDLPTVLQRVNFVWQHGREFDACYIPATQAIHLTPLAIRQEAAAYLDVYGEEFLLSESMRWALTASDEELTSIAADVLWDSDSLWMQFSYTVREAIDDAYANIKKGN